MIGRLVQYCFHRSSDIGRRGEKLAARYHRRRGYRILARNVRNRFGEIDLIVRLRRDPHTIIFVEVKSAEAGLPPPETRVDLRKQRRLVALSAQILRRQHLEHKRVRYDVIAVVLGDHGKATVRHHIAAFESHV